MVGRSGGGRDGMTYSRWEMIEPSSTNDVMPRPNSTWEKVVKPSTALAPPAIRPPAAVGRK